jgi:hypothetical protein
MPMQRGYYSRQRQQDQPLFAEKCTVRAAQNLSHPREVDCSLGLLGNL